MEDIRARGDDDIRLQSRARIANKYGPRTENGRGSRGWRLFLACSEDCFFDLVPTHQALRAQVCLYLLLIQLLRFLCDSVLFIRLSIRVNLLFPNSLFPEKKDFRKKLVNY